MTRASGKKLRRGSGLASLVLVLALLNIVVMGLMAPSGEQSELDALRLDTTRAFYAAESGGRVVVRCLKSGIGLPTAGTTLSVGPGTAQFVQVPAGVNGEAVVLGSSGLAQRRLRITLGTGTP